MADRCSTPGCCSPCSVIYAMRKLREVHTRHQLSPRQFQLLGLLHDRGAMVSASSAR